jgi:membrane-associated protease RseP (regulator of RpoE activity)
MMRKLGLGILLAALALPGLGAAQEVAWSIQSNRGWIGIYFDYSVALFSGEEQTVVVIGEVVEGSPAEAAGVRAGDTLTHLDGQPISQEVFASLTRNLEVGDLVRLTILRQAPPREVLVEAGAWPEKEGMMAPFPGEMVIRLDSVRGAILKNLDSLRLSIARLQVDPSGGVSIRIVKTPIQPTKGDEWLDLAYRIRYPEVDTLRFLGPDLFVVEPELAIPFTAFVAGSEETNHLREQLRQLRKEITESRREELARVRELQASIQGPVEEAVRRDPRVREIREREQALVERQAHISDQLKQLSESVMRRQYVEMQARQEEALSQARRAQEQASRRYREQYVETSRARERGLQEEYESWRPLNHIIVGQNFVAGAQLTPLNSTLAEYFQVDEGVLVTEVLDGTPAFEAGLVAGDVIVRVGGEEVTSLSDLRFGIGYFDRPLKLRVIRKGDAMEIVIRK